MGNEISHKARHKKLHPKHLFHAGVQSTLPGQLIYSCSYESWLRHAALACNCADTADYTQYDGDFREGLLCRADMTDGRYFKVSQLCPIKIRLEEKRKEGVFEVFVNEARTSGHFKKALHQDFRASVVTMVQQSTTKDGVNVIGCRGSLAVVQFLDRKENYIPEFYFIDLISHKFLGKFSCTDCEMLWYECYISPDESHIILRPDVNTYEGTTDECMKSHKVYNLTVITMRRFKDFGGHALAFDNRHGNRYIFRAKDKDIQLFDLHENCVVQSQLKLPLPASIRLLKVSASGIYIAARCLYPTFGLEHVTNVIAVISSVSLQVLFIIDVKGPHWRSSQIVNMHTFPQFSSCESALAVMRNSSSKRKVLLYRLPIVSTVRLMHWCRVSIRRCIAAEFIPNLPLPPTLVRYLTYAW